MQLIDIKRRMQRLEQLPRGLAQEVGLWREAGDLLLFRERKRDLAGIQEALAGAEAARGVLLRVVQRGGGAEGPWGGNKRPLGPPLREAPGFPLPPTGQDRMRLRAIRLPRSRKTVDGLPG